MKKRSNLDATLCENFCTYYKPGKNEEFACEGFVVVHRLIGRGKEISLKKRKTAKQAAAAEDALRASMCGNCSFHESDCDYILTRGKAVPCGGFMLLSHHLAAGDITLEEIVKTP